MWETRHVCTWAAAAVARASEADAYAATRTAPAFGKRADMHIHSLASRVRMDEPVAFGVIPLTEYTFLHSTLSSRFIVALQSVRMVVLAAAVTLGVATLLPRPLQLNGGMFKLKLGKLLGDDSFELPLLLECKRLLEQNVCGKYMALPI